MKYEPIDEISQHRPRPSAGAVSSILIQTHWEMGRRLSSRQSRTQLAGLAQQGSSMSTRQSSSLST
jgi:hypothetical protein